MGSSVVPVVEEVPAAHVTPIVLRRVIDKVQ